MGNSVRGRGDEPSLDRRAQRVRAVGEDHSPRILGGQGCRAFPDGLGWLDGPFGSSLAWDYSKKMTGLLKPVFCSIAPQHPGPGRGSRAIAFDRVNRP